MASHLQIHPKKKKKKISLSLGCVKGMKVKVRVNGGVSISNILCEFVCITQQNNQPHQPFKLKIHW